MINHNRIVPVKITPEGLIELQPDADALYGFDAPPLSVKSAERLILDLQKAIMKVESGNLKWSNDE